MPSRLKSHIILVLDRLQCVAWVNCLVHYKNTSYASRHAKPTRFFTSSACLNTFVKYFHERASPEMITSHYPKVANAERRRYCNLWDYSTVLDCLVFKAIMWVMTYGVILKTALYNANTGVFSSEFFICSYIVYTCNNTFKALFPAT